MDHWPSMSRVLLITSVLPWPLHRNGGAQRTALVGRALERLGHAVDLFALLPDLPGPPLDAAALRDAHVVHVERFPIDPTVARPLLNPFGKVIRRWEARYAPLRPAADWVARRVADGAYEAIVVRYAQTAMLCGLDAPPRGAPPVHVDLDDVDWLTLASRFEADPWPGLKGRVGMHLALRTVRRRCQTALPHFASRFVASEEDAAELARLDISSNVLPNIPFSTEGRAIEPVPPPPHDGAPIVLFVGDLQFGPNHTGLDRFLGGGWPAVRASVPTAELRIAGRGVTDEQQARWDAVAGVRTLGFVEDLRAAYTKCRATLAPTWWGGGTKIKVVESAALGRACVATSHAARGYEPLTRTAPASVWTADTESGLAAALIRLLTDSALCAASGSAGACAAQRHFGAARLTEVLAEALASASHRSRQVEQPAPETGPAVWNPGTALGAQPPVAHPEVSKRS